MKSAGIILLTVLLAPSTGNVMAVEEAKYTVARPEVTGEPVWGRYNAPFTPWFMRRNEILIPIGS